MKYIYIICKLSLKLYDILNGALQTFSYKMLSTSEFDTPKGIRLIFLPTQTIKVKCFDYFVAASRKIIAQMMENEEIKLARYILLFSTRAIGTYY